MHTNACWHDTEKTCCSQKLATGRFARSAVVYNSWCADVKWSGRCGTRGLFFLSERFNRVNDLRVNDCLWVLSERFVKWTIWVLTIEWTICEWTIWIFEQTICERFNILLRISHFNLSDLWNRSLLMIRNMPITWLGRATKMRQLSSKTCMRSKLSGMVTSGLEGLSRFFREKVGINCNHNNAHYS